MAAVSKTAGGAIFHSVKVGTADLTPTSHKRASGAQIKSAEATPRPAPPAAHRRAPAAAAKRTETLASGLKSGLL